MRKGSEGFFWIPDDCVTNKPRYDHPRSERIERTPEQRSRISKSMGQIWDGSTFDVDSAS